MSQARTAGRIRRHRRIRKRVVGMPERPRLNIFRSHKHLYAQIINDFEGRTLVGISTKVKSKAGSKTGGNVPAAETLGQRIAGEALKQGITRVVFDRGGYRYHGRIKAMADAARKAGLEF